MNSLWPLWLAQPFWLRFGLQNVVVGILGALAGWAPLASEWRGRESLRQQIAQTQTQLELYRGKLAQLPSADALSAQWRELVERPAASGGASVHGRVMAALRQSGARLLSWHTITDDSEPSQTMRNWQLILGADYHRLLRFLQAFNSAPHPVRIVRLAIARDKDELTLTLVLSAIRGTDERQPNE
ncbi:hypothetical protein FJU30_21505 [Affinibrenneria salicis]|uniref:Pilus assembly protein PilO n=1 Tax=Affinibrenneria salicis TaxID=2590031 RepID=A0A5J5FSM0_9GAMM|nr:hypothetical protein [Affinibrenneria salicis]KAA8996372.1 hypothetical protein FJU30_21505 [Affinibrenneria salicis]